MIIILYFGHYKIISGIIFLHVCCYLSTRFTEEYFTNTNRGYGASVSTVFIKLRKCQFEDVYGPAQQQFQGIITTRPTSFVIILLLPHVYTQTCIVIYTYINIHKYDYTCTDMHMLSRWTNKQSNM